MAAAPAPVPASADEEYAMAKTSVWWDIENCQVPRNCDPQLLGQNIRSALSSMGYKGPVSILSFGDTGKVPPSVMNALHSTGIGLIHVPSGAKDASDKKILADMIFWAVDNPPPANYLLISGDRDFSYALHQLRMRRYNILLAQPPCVSSTLVAAAKTVWNWKDLVAGGTPLLEPYAGSTTNNRAQSIETSKEVGPSTENMGSNSAPFASSFNLSNQKFSNSEKPDSRQIRKTVCRPQNEGQGSGNTPRNINVLKQPSSGSEALIADSVTPLVEYGIEQKTQMMTSASEEQGSAASNSKIGNSSPFVSPTMAPAEAGNPYQTEATAIKGAPHELFRANMPETLRSPLPGNNTSLDGNKKKGKPFKNYQSQQSPQPTKVGNSFVSKKLPSQQSAPSIYLPHLRNNGVPLAPSQNRPNSQTFPLTSSVSLPDIGRHHIPSHYIPGQKLHNPRNDRSLPLEHPVTPHIRPDLYQNSNHRPQLSSAACNAPVHGHSTEIGAFIGTILSALSKLKIDKMAPTETNLTDCILYGEMNKRNFNVKAALEYAVQHEAVVMHKLGHHLPFYIGKNDTLWKCVNPVDLNCKHPTAIWDEIFNFLSSPHGCSEIMRSECRYHAAFLLKKACLQNLVMGEVLQIVHVIINDKKWIIPSPSWQPIYLNLPSVGRDAKGDAVQASGSHASS